MTTTAIQKKDSAVGQIARQLDYSEDFVQTVKDTYAKGASDLELKLFLQSAKRTGLDPFARQIYCIKRYDSSLQKPVMSTQISIDGFRLIADRTGCYVPSKEPTYTFDQNNKLESATAYIKKLVAGTWHEVSATAFYDEYVQTKKDGEPNSMWKKMPRLMLAKTAESLVLRKAFPAELSGLYTPEEMGTAEFIQPVENPVSARLVSLQPTLSALNQNNDSIRWTFKTLLEFAEVNFDESFASLEEMDEEVFQILKTDLEERLNELSAEPIVGEVLESEPIAE